MDCDRSESDELFGGVASVVEARTRLDFSIRGYNRHSRLGEQYQRALDVFTAAAREFEASRDHAEELLTEIAAQQAERQLNVQRWRAARAAAAQHRVVVHDSVRDYVVRLRDEGAAPERALRAVKHRLVHAVTAATPDAPRYDADRLAADVSAWAIDAYYAA